jgi:hypothetical protein
MIIFPDALFDKYTEGYDIINYMVPAKYNNGINRFRSDLMNGVDVRSLIDSGGGKVVIVFDINEKGEKENIHLEEEIIKALTILLYKELRILKENGLLNGTWNSG